MLHSEYCPCATCNPNEPKALRIKRLEAYIAASERMAEIAQRPLRQIALDKAKYEAELNELKANLG